jgi:hypothetical protein
MASRSMISDICWVEPTTVIEVARRAAGLSQRRLAEIARTQQSSISEYESRRKSPTLDVIERLLDAADAKLAAKPLVDFDLIEDPNVGSFWVPDRLWSVPLPTCFAQVQALKWVFPSHSTRTWTHDIRVWDLSREEERIDYYEQVLPYGMLSMLEESVDGILLIQAWPHMKLPEVVRAAWQPLIEAATASQDARPRDPGEVSAWMAGELGLRWPPRARRRRG